MKNVIGSIVVAVSLMGCSGAYAVTLCPDGSYVYGSCTLMPNGTYIGS